MYKYLIIIVSVLLLNACSEDDLSFDEGEDYYYNDYKLVNASNHELDFHMVNRDVVGKYPDVYKSKYRVASLTPQHTPYKIRHERNFHAKIKFAITAPYHEIADNSVKYKVNNKTDYHVIGWDKLHGVEISVVEQKQSNKTGEFRIRFFITEATTQLALEDNTITYNTAKETDFYTIKNCLDSIKVAEQPVDICQATPGYSYLLILSADGESMLVREN